MDVTKKYFKEEFQSHMLDLHYPKPSQFYLSAWQTNRSPVLLLILRCVLFLSSVGIVLASMILYGLSGILQYWFIYLTHWGLLSIVVATGFATAVSARSYFVKPISAEFILPWYVKSYWVAYNVAIPLAFLITIFYWTVLFEAGVSEELNPGLDVAVHGLNTVIMFLLIMTSAQPSRILHLYHPIAFALTYVAFGLIYYLAGGTDTEGNRYIYFVIDWSRAGVTIGAIALTGLLLVLLHLLTVGLALARDAISGRCLRLTAIDHVEEGVALRQTTRS